jgi:hypothetical protein
MRDKSSEDVITLAGGLKEEVPDTMLAAGVKELGGATAVLGA